MPVAARHYVMDAPMEPPFPGRHRLLFGMGCFWGAERLFWQHEGVYSTAVGYAGGSTPNPTYAEVCSGRTGHAEVVHVVYDPHETDCAAMLRLFFEGHDPTQGKRQGNDVGEQYRSVACCYTDGDRALAFEMREAYASLLSEAGYPEITTEIISAPEFYYAEAAHQQYLPKNPNGYCGLGGTGIRSRC